MEDRAGPGSAGDAARPTDSSDLPERTLAGRIAQELQNEIVRKRWPIGAALGSEVELMERFGASRSVIREARRILESRLVAKPKPGPGGGLVVTAPDMAAFTEVARLFLDYRGFQSEDLFEIWVAVETALLRRMIPQLTDGQVEELVAIASQVNRSRDSRRAGNRNLHSEIGRISGNPIAELLLQVLVDVARLHSEWFTEAARQHLVDQHEELVDAIVARDVERAVAQVRRIFDELRESKSVNIDYFFTPPDEGMPRRPE